MVGGQCRTSIFLIMYGAVCLCAKHWNGCEYKQREFSCRDANLTRFPPREIIPKDAQVIDLSLNRITSLSRDEIPSNVSMKVLNLSYNSISSIEYNTFKDLYSLEILDLSYNRLIGSSLIIKISRFELSEFHNLKKISFRGNPLGFVERLTFTSFGYRQVEYLDLSRCEIRTLQHLALDNLMSLRALDLSHNSLRVFDPESVLGLRHLERLDLSHNKISQITDMPLLHSLRILDLQGNRITTMADNAFTHTPNIRSLSLRYNRLQYLTHLQIPWGSVNVDLRDNPWKCDCNMKYLLENEMANFTSYNYTIICDTPSRLRGKDIKSLKEEELRCVSSSWGVVTSVVISVTIAVIVGVIAVIICKTCKNLRNKQSGRGYRLLRFPVSIQGKRKQGDKAGDDS